MFVALLILRSVGAKVQLVDVSFGSITRTSLCVVLTSHYQEVRSNTKDTLGLSETAKMLMPEIKHTNNQTRKQTTPPDLDWSA